MSKGTVDDASALSMKGLSFAYAGARNPVLHDVKLTVSVGDFALIVGGTGAGKSTLLRLATPALIPAGSCEGTITLFSRNIFDIADEAAPMVGLVLQDSDAQIICDTVRDEMAFGLESMGLPQAEMSRRIAETATFLGMAPWFGRQTAELSGGQRQTLALAATLAMRPQLLLLDEPVAQLDPIAATAFAALVGRANRELGLTVIVATHSPAAFLPFANCAFVVENGRVFSSSPDDAAHADDLDSLMEKNDASAYGALHESIRSSRTTSDARSAEGVSKGAGEHADVVPSEKQRKGVGADVGRTFAERFSARGSEEAQANTSLAAMRNDQTLNAVVPTPILELRDLWFRHARQDPWLLSGFNLSLRAGEVHALMGGNGSGKTTLLRLAGAAIRPQRGHIQNYAARSMAYLPQTVRALIGCETLHEELMAWSQTAGYSEDEALECASDLGFAVSDSLLERHPFDLSGGQQRLLALAKVLLIHPQLLLLDEPTVGLDAAARMRVARMVSRVSTEGHAVLMATHDLAFARVVASKVTLVFDGRAAVCEGADSFFSQAWLWGV